MKISIKLPLAIVTTFLTAMLLSTIAFAAYHYVDDSSGSFTSQNLNTAYACTSATCKHSNAKYSYTGYVTHGRWNYPNGYYSFDAFISSAYGNPTYGTVKYKVSSSGGFASQIVNHTTYKGSWVFVGGIYGGTSHNNPNVLLDMLDCVNVCTQTIAMFDETCGYNSSVGSLCHY